MALDPKVQEAQTMIKQSIIQSLMQNQGMSYDEAEAYANQRIEATTPAEGSPMNPMELSTMEVAGTPPVQATAPSQAPAPVATPAEQQAVSSPSSPSVMSESPSIFDNPEAVESVLGMGGRNREMQYAEGMRNMDTPQGRYVSNGRVYVASNPLEHAAKVYGAYKGNKMIKGLEEEQMEAKKAIIEALRNKTAQPTNTFGGVPV